MFYKWTYRIGYEAPANALQEPRQTQIIPVPVLPFRLAFCFSMILRSPVGFLPVRKRTLIDSVRLEHAKIFESLIDMRNHAPKHDLAGSMGDGEKHISKLKRW